MKPVFSAKPASVNLWNTLGDFNLSKHGRASASEYPFSCCRVNPNTMLQNINEKRIKSKVKNGRKVSFWLD